MLGKPQYLEPTSPRRRQNQTHHAAGLRFCYVPYDPASRNIPLRGKLIFSYGLTFVCLFLLLAEIVVGKGCVPLSDNMMWGPSASTLLTMGALQQRRVINGEFWRVFWSPFLHAGVFHYLANFVFWVRMGPLIEPDWGFWKTFFIFMMGAITGNLLSVCLDGSSIAVGASGGMFGIVGGMIVYVCEFASTIPHPRLTFYIMLFSLFLGIAGSFMPGVDCYAHMGGAFGGFLAGIISIYQNQMDFKRLLMCVPERGEVVVEDPPKPKRLSSEFKEKKMFMTEAYHMAEYVNEINEESDVYPVNDFIVINKQSIKQGNQLEEDENTPILANLGNEAAIPTTIFKERQYIPEVSAEETTRMSRRANFKAQMQQFLSETKSRLAAAPQEFYATQIPGLFRRQGKTHFIFVGGELNERRIAESLVGKSPTTYVECIALNAAAIRRGLRRTPVVVLDDEINIRSLGLWVVRTAAFIVLMGTWTLLLYYTLACPECFVSPGQIVTGK